MGRKLTNEQFLQKLKNLGREDVEPLEEYKGSKEKILCRCRIHNYVWKVTPADLFDGYGCPKCKSDKISKAKRKSVEQFMKDFKKKGNPNVKLIGTYKKAASKIECECKNNPEHRWFTTPDCLLRGYGCPHCAKLIGRDKKSNEQFLKELKEINPNIMPLEEYKGARDSIKLQCKINSKHIWYNSPTHLLNGEGCPFCAPGHKILENDEHTLGKERPDLLKYFQDEDKPEAFKVSVKSSKKFYFICPECKRVKTKEISVNTLSTYGFSCDYCSDGISIPNKIIRNISLQLKEQKIIEDYYCEHSPKWLRPYRYDCFWIINKNKFLAIEMDGVGHFNGNNPWSDTMAKERDKIKDILSQENGVELIRINCSKITFDSIKDELLNNEIIKNYLINIDWEIVNKSSQNNLMKEVCEYYNNHTDERLLDIGKKFKINKMTAGKYIRRGEEFGWCKESPSKRAVRLQGKKVKIYDEEMNFLIETKTLEEAYKYVKDNKGTCSWSIVKDCLNDKRESYKGYKFEYVNKNNKKK